MAKVLVTKQKGAVMSDIACKCCGAAEYVKNGTVRGLQRYKCKSCGCNFTATEPRGKPPAMKALAQLLYAMGNMSFCSIARLLKVSDVAVLKWIRAAAKNVPEPEVGGNVIALSLDEMWHFLKKRAKNSGFGEHMTLCIGEPLPGFLVVVMIKPVKSSSTKSV